MKNTHGGARKGAGRPKGTGQGRKALPRSVSLRGDLWAKLDRICKAKGMTRSAWIAERVRLATVPVDRCRCGKALPPVEDYETPYEFCSVKCRNAARTAK